MGRFPETISVPAERRPRAAHNQKLGEARPWQTADGGRVAGPRCIALVGPFASGKTTLLEAILARTGAITRQGTIAEKNTVGDASPRRARTR